VTESAAGRWRDAVTVRAALGEIGDACACLADAEGVLERCSGAGEGWRRWVTDGDGGDARDRGRPSDHRDDRGAPAGPG
jgi:hypothetical protein